MEDGSLGWVLGYSFARTFVDNRGIGSRQGKGRVKRGVGICTIQGVGRIEEAGGCT